ncbi:hypothetical protein FHS67_002197 [Aminobacter aminovorans]|uniref:Uncharacterized protein n=1 Tax=Aminobacter aminovorans TaxID=83263 RepID=A0ABR6H5U1_AMIAI|nr:hypothetical protein [Aminobacter aminovorans]MBB3705878.1 hypothetical protein [Aminobacter aminovorans]
MAMTLLLLWRPAVAQSLCAPAPDFLHRFEVKLGEFVVLRGDTSNGRQIVVTRAEDGRWSIIEITEDVGCLLMEGEASEFDNGI